MSKFQVPNSFLSDKIFIVNILLSSLCSSPFCFYFFVKVQGSFIYLINTYGHIWCSNQTQITLVIYYCNLDSWTLVYSLISSHSGWFISIGSEYFTKTVVFISAALVQTFWLPLLYTKFWNVCSKIHLISRW